MKTKEQQKSTIETDEFNLICDVMNGILIEENYEVDTSVFNVFGCKTYDYGSYFKNCFLLELDDVIDSSPFLEEKWNVNYESLRNKIIAFPNNEMADLYTKVKNFWR
jgi:hypothetical protein